MNTVKTFNNNLIHILCVLCAINVFSCAYEKEAHRRLTPPKSTRDFRIEKIEESIPADPAKAIHLIGIFEIIYGGENTNEHQKIAELKERAIQNLKNDQEKAVTEKRWDDAASLERSLDALGIAPESSVKESNYLMAQAKEFLTNGNELAAFLTAVRSNEIAPVKADDALLFLKQAVRARQRRTAAFFLAIADRYGAAVDKETRLFAQGSDDPSAMIKGVATVLIDKGIKIERGRGFADRVLGSAFFVDSTGLAITNYHVIESEVDPTYNGRSKMYIRLGDSTSAQIPAKVIGWDKTMDLALIKAEYKPEYVFSVVDRAIPKVGESVLAIGSPGGLEKTVTMGIVSALGRRFLQVGDVIQIDAAVNHGNSGGPVIDMQGRLVGIVFAGIEQFPGLNFAVPAERLAAALPAMIAGGKAVRPWLGLTIAETAQGAEIIYVSPLTPAADQVVKDGIYITTLSGREITAGQGLLIPAMQDVLFDRRAGELVSLVTSDGKSRVLQMAARPLVPLADAAKIDSRERMAAPLFGLILEPSVGKSITPSYLIKKVVRGSIADEAGLSLKDPVTIQGFRLQEKEGYAMLEINVKKRLSGYFDTYMTLP